MDRRRVTHELLNAFYRSPTEESFLPLYEDTRNLVYTLCRRILGDENDVRDAFQSTYCRLLSAARGADRTPPGGDERATVYRLAVREAQNLRQRRRRCARKEAPLQPPRIADPRPGPDELAAHGQLRERVESLVDRLPDRYRLPVLLHYVHGLSYPEIAGILERPVGTISSSIARALRKLDPMMRRAGLGESAGTLGVLAAGAQLLTAPRSLRGAEVFRSADAALASGLSTTTMGAATSSLATVLLGTTIMKTKTAIVSAVIAAVAAGIIGLAVTSSNDEPAAPAIASNTEEPEPASTPGGSESAASPIEEAAVDGATRSRAATPGASRPALTGLVRDLATGEPIPGAEIHSRPGEPAVTDENGAYALERLTSGRLRVSADGYVMVAAQIDQSGGGEMIRNFELEPAVEALVRVIDTEDRPIEGARIGMLLGFVHHETEHRTDASGEVLVGGLSRTNPRELFAKKDGFKSSSRARPVYGRDEEGTSRVTLVLERFQPEIGYYAGLVTDTAGEPLPGMEVVANYVDQTSTMETERTKTDANGRYLLALKNPRSEFEHFAGGGEFAPQSRRGIPPGTKDEPAEIDFVLEEGHWIAGVVVDQTGEPIPDLRIQADGIFGDILRHALLGKNRPTTTDAEGRFRIEGAPPTGVVLRVYADGYSAFRETFEVDQEVRLVLRPRGIVRGRVVDKATGEPVPDFMVRKTEGRSDYHLVRRTPVSVHSGEGRFTIDDLEHGKEYSVRVEAPRFLPGVIESVVALSREEAEEVVVELETGRSLSGRVVEARSVTPLAGVPVVVAFLDEGASFQWGGIDDPAYSHMLTDAQRTTTAEDGSFRFVEGEREGSILVKAPGYLPVRVDPERRAAQVSKGEIVIRLEPGGSISGVYFFQGAPRSGTRISTWDGRVGYGPVTTDDQGRFLLDGMPAGVHKVEANAYPDRLFREIQLDEGEEKVVNIGEDLGPLTLGGRVRDGDGTPIADGGIILKPAFDWDYVEFRTQVDVEGRYRVEGLVRGRYELRAWARVDGESRHIVRTVDATGNVEEDFVFDPSHTVRARLVSWSGAPAEMMSRLHGVRLQAVDKPSDARSRDQGSIDTFSASKIEDGEVSLKGRFRGAYRLTLEFEGDGVESTVDLPEPVILDNLEGDQDLGAIAIPAFGWVELSLDYDPRTGELPEYAYLTLPRRGAATPSFDNTSFVGLRPPAARQVIGPLEPGTFRCALTVWGFRCEPAWTTLTVEPGGASTVDFDLTPEGLVYGVIQIGARDVPLRRVTLTGAGVERVLTHDPSRAGRNILSMVGTYEDVTDGLRFAFHNLPQGVYELTVEVEGYRVWRGTRTVVPGRGRREDISTLERRP